MIKLTFILFTTVVLAGLSSARADQQADTLISRGLRCMDSQQYQCAREHFITAYTKGMSQDSLCFFMSDLYLRTGKYDSSLVMHYAASKGSLQDTLLQQQRIAIYSTLGWQSKIDSLRAQQHPTTSWRIEPVVGIASSRMLVDSILVAPTNDLVAGLPDTARTLMISGLTLGCQIPLSQHMITWSTMLNVSAPLRSLRPDSSAIMAGGVIGIKNITTNSSLQLNVLSSFQSSSMRSWMTSDFSLPLSGSWSTLANGVVRLGDDRSPLDEVLLRLGVQTQRTISQTNRIIITLHGGYTYDGSQIMANLPLNYKLGYTDSIRTNEPMRYFFDKECTRALSSEFLYDDYIATLSTTTQPYPLSLPKHGLNGSLAATLLTATKNKVIFTVHCALEGVYFPEKVRWFSSGSNQLFSDASFKEDSLIMQLLVHNREQNRYYLNTAPFEQYNSSGLVPLVDKSSQRIEGKMSILSLIRVPVLHLGVLELRAGYSIYGSTLPKDAPLPRPLHSFDLQSTFKKEFSFR